MNFRATIESKVSVSNFRAVFAALLMAFLVSCASGAKEAEIAAEQAAQVAAEQEAAALEQERERQRMAQMQRDRELREAERARLRAEREKRDEEQRAEEERTRIAQERAAEEARMARERQAAIAAAQAERQEKLQRIAELESLIANMQVESSDNDGSVVALNEAVSVAEELLDTLTAEQAKYENTDESGQTIEPLAKELIAELEARKEELVGQVRGQ